MHFYKYHGAGNDFILVDQRSSQPLTRDNTGLIGRLCERRFGIGADGLILLQQKAGYDFEMVYFNADGRESTLCGNGGRCITAFAHKLGLVQHRCRFWAIDGEHESVVSDDGQWVELHMHDVQQVDLDQHAYVLNTGSPHYVVFKSGVDLIDVFKEGAEVRFSDRYRQVGINVNFVEDQGDALLVRTYERGVENETLACGTGVTAAVLAHHLKKKGTTGIFETTAHARGGVLKVRFSDSGDGIFRNIWLCGPAEFVYQGDIELS